MTAAEMKFAFNVGFDSIANFSSPGYEDKEISLFLTQAQQNVFLDLIDPSTGPRSSASKQELNKIILAELITSFSTSPLPTNNSTDSELLSSSNWTSTGWTGNYGIGFTHTVGNTTVLSNTLAPTIGLNYQISFSIVNRTAGTCTIALGGSSFVVSKTGIVLFIAGSTSNLQITPTSDFNGTINISVKTLVTSNLNLPNGQFVTLPLDFFFPLSESGKITFNNTSYYWNFTTKFPSNISSNIYIKPITRLEYNSNIKSHIRKPNEDIIWRMEYQRITPTSVIGTGNTKIYELIGDGTYSITGYTCSYYRRPVNIQIEGTPVICELDPFVHQTIVNDAIRIAAAAIKDQQKYQTATIETQNQQ